MPSRRTGQDPNVTFYMTKSGRKMGRILYWLDVPGQEKRIQKSAPLGDMTDMTEAQIERTRREAVMRLGIFKPQTEIPSPDSFAECAEKWLLYELPKQRHHYTPRHHVKKYLIPAFGKLPVDSITRDVLNRWIGQVRLGDRSKPSRNTLLHIVGTLRQIVAPRLDNVEITYPSDANPEEETYCPTDDEVQRIIANARGYFRILVLMLVQTGMRISEALGLLVSDIDFERGVLFIQRGAVDGRIGPTKNRNSRRIVSVHPSLIRAIEEHLGGRKTGTVFQSRNGTPYRQSNLHDDEWQPTLKRANLEAKAKDHEGHFGFHGLRHYSVSFCIRMGMSFTDVKLRHGHGSERIMRRYMHLTPGYDSRILSCIPDPFVTTGVTIEGVQKVA